MRARTIAFFLGCALAAAAVRADVTVGFAVPDDGRVTLGVFDTSGRLVRILHRLAPQEDFRVGLNGLLTVWDGKNDAGETVVPGRYHVRGYLVGEAVAVAGEEFLFNDFAGDKGFPGLVRILGISRLENGDALLLGETPGQDLLLSRFSDAGGFTWANVQALDSPPPPDSSFPPLLAANGIAAMVLAPGFEGTFALETGALLRPLTPPVASPLAAAGNAANWFLSSATSVASVPVEGTEPAAEAPAPAAFTALDADATTLLAATIDGVWIRRENWEKWSGPTGARSVSLGPPGTFWLVDPGASLVAEASFGGEILRAMQTGPGEPAPQEIRASRSSEAFLVLEGAPGLQRLRAMSRSDDGKWEIDWERTIRDCRRFGFAEGGPVPDAGDAAPPTEIRIHLQENPLSGRRDFLLVHAAFDASGTGLFSPDGLPLVHVSSRADVRRVALHRGSLPDSAIFLQGNGAFVEQFSIQGLADILPIDAGDIDWP